MQYIKHEPILEDPTFRNKEKVTFYEESGEMHFLWELVLKHRLEEDVPPRSNVRAQRWTKAWAEYLDSGRVASIIALQRRWHELKLQARARIHDYWATRTIPPENLTPTNIPLMSPFSHIPSETKDSHNSNKNVKNTITKRNSTFVSLLAIAATMEHLATKTTQIDATRAQIASNLALMATSTTQLETTMTQMAATNTQIAAAMTQMAESLTEVIVNSKSMCATSKQIDANSTQVDANARQMNYFLETTVKVEVLDGKDVIPVQLAPLHLDMLRKYPHIATAPLVSWEDLVDRSCIVPKPLNDAGDQSAVEPKDEIIEIEMEMQLKKRKHQDLFIDLDDDDDVPLKVLKTETQFAIDLTDTSDVEAPDTKLTVFSHKRVKSNVQINDYNTASLVQVEEDVTEKQITTLETVNSTKTLCQNKNMSQLNLVTKNSTNVFTKTKYLAENEIANLPIVKKEIHSLDNDNLELEAVCRIIGTLPDEAETGSAGNGTVSNIDATVPTKSPSISGNGFKMFNTYSSQIRTKILFNSPEDSLCGETIKPQIYGQPLSSKERLKDKLIFAEDDLMDDLAYMPVKHEDSNVTMTLDNGMTEDNMTAEERVTTEVKEHQDVDIDDLKGRQNTPEIDRKLLLDVRINIVRIDKISSWKKHSIGTSTMNINELSMCELTPDIEPAYWYLGDTKAVNNNNAVIDTAMIDNNRQTHNIDFFMHQLLNKGIDSALSKQLPSYTKIEGREQDKQLLEIPTQIDDRTSINDVKGIKEKILNPAKISNPHRTISKKGESRLKNLNRQIAKRINTGMKKDIRNNSVVEKGTLFKFDKNTTINNTIYNDVLHTRKEKDNFVILGQKVADIQIPKMSVISISDGEYSTNRKSGPASSQVHKKRDNIDVVTIRKDDLPDVVPVIDISSDENENSRIIYTEQKQDCNMRIEIVKYQNDLEETTPGDIELLSNDEKMKSLDMKQNTCKYKNKPEDDKPVKNVPSINFNNNLVASFSHHNDTLNDTDNKYVNKTKSYEDKIKIDENCNKTPSNIGMVVISYNDDISNKKDDTRHNLDCDSLGNRKVLKLQDKVAMSDITKVSRLKDGVKSIIDTKICSRSKAVNDDKTLNVDDCNNFLFNQSNQYKPKNPQYDKKSTVPNNSHIPEQSKGYISNQHFETIFSDQDAEIHNDKIDHIIISDDEQCENGKELNKNHVEHYENGKARRNNEKKEELLPNLLKSKNYAVPAAIKKDCKLLSDARINIVRIDKISSWKKHSNGTSIFDINKLSMCELTPDITPTYWYLGDTKAVNNNNAVIDTAVINTAMIDDNDIKADNTAIVTKQLLNKTTDSNIIKRLQTYPKIVVQDQEKQLLEIPTQIDDSTSINGIVPIKEKLLNLAKISNPHRTISKKGESRLKNPNRQIAKRIKTGMNKHIRNNSDLEKRTLFKFDKKKTINNTKCNDLLQTRKEKVNFVILGRNVADTQISKSSFIPISDGEYSTNRKNGSASSQVQKKRDNIDVVTIRNENLTDGFPVIDISSDGVDDDSKTNNTNQNQDYNVRLQIVKYQNDIEEPTPCNVELDNNNEEMTSFDVKQNINEIKNTPEPDKLVRNGENFQPIREHIAIVYKEETYVVENDSKDIVFNNDLNISKTYCDKSLVNSNISTDVPKSNIDNISVVSFSYNNENSKDKEKNTVNRTNNHEDITQIDTDCKNKTTNFVMAVTSYSYNETNRKDVINHNLDSDNLQNHKVFKLHDKIATSDTEASRLNDGAKSTICTKTFSRSKIITNDDKIFNTEDDNNSLSYQSNPNKPKNVEYEKKSSVKSNSNNPEASKRNIRNQHLEFIFSNQDAEQIHNDKIQQYKNEESNRTLTEKCTREQGKKCTRELGKKCTRELGKKCTRELGKKIMLPHFLKSENYAVRGAIQKDDCFDKPPNFSSGEDLVKAENTSSKRLAKKVNLQDMEEVRRVNSSILTAQVAPINNSTTDAPGQRLRVSLQ